MAYWTPEDLLAGRCELDDLGKVKPEPGNGSASEDDGEWADKPMRDVLLEWMKRRGKFAYLDELAEDSPRTLAALVKELLPKENRIEQSTTMKIVHSLSLSAYRPYVAPFDPVGTTTYEVEGHTPEDIVRLAMSFPSEVREYIARSIGPVQSLPPAVPESDSEVQQAQEALTKDHRLKKH